MALLTLQTVTDYDGNVYPYVTVGDLDIMLKNYRCTHFSDGALIPIIEKDDEWYKSREGAMCFYQNKNINDSTYGALYNWYVTMSNLFAPVGWRIPSDADWEQLEKEFRKRVESHNSKCLTVPNLKGLLDVEMAGYRDLWGWFGKVGKSGRYWSTTRHANGALTRSFCYSSVQMKRTLQKLNYGFSIRCVRDHIEGQESEISIFLSKIDTELLFEELRRRIK